MMRSTGLRSRTESATSAAKPLAHGGDAVLGVDVPDVGALRRLAAVADRRPRDG